MVIIRCNIDMTGDQFLKIHAGLVEMAKMGVILLPQFCELLKEVPPDEGVMIVREGAD